MLLKSDHLRSLLRPSISYGTMWFGALHCTWISCWCFCCLLNLFLKFAVFLCFYLSFILFLKVVMTAANITKRLVKEKTMDWVNTTFPSKLMGWIVMTIMLVLKNCSDNLRFKPYLFSFLFIQLVSGLHKFWSQATGGPDVVCVTEWIY